MRPFNLVTLVLSITLTACGGGGGGGTNGPIASANSFDIQSGWSRLVANGYTKTLTVSGSCNGTYTATDGPATAGATFENAPALSANSVTNMTLTNCTPASSIDTEVDYYDSNYRLMGFSSVSGDYGVWIGTPVLPIAAKVGDVTTVGSANLYTNSTKATSAGREDVTLVMEADTATTAIGTLVIKYYSAAPYNRLEQTIQRKFRVGADNSLTLIGMDVQFANGTQTHLVMN